MSDIDNDCKLSITPLPSNSFCRAQVQKEARPTCLDCSHGKLYITGAPNHKNKDWKEINQISKSNKNIGQKKEEDDMPVPKDRQCSVKGCEKYSVKNGMCIKHLKAAGTVIKKSSCTTPGCNSPLQKDGLCYKCFKKKHGHSPYGKTAKTKAVKTKHAKTDKRKPAAGKPSGNGSKKMADLMAMISQAGKEQLRAEMAPMFQDLRSRIDRIEGYLN